MSHIYALIRARRTHASSIHVAVDAPSQSTRMYDTIRVVWSA
jgi:hypothetical protein